MIDPDKYLCLTCWRFSGGRGAEMLLFLYKYLSQQVKSSMNYLKVYCNLIRKAQQRQVVEGYTEKHHIFPVSIFGKNDKIVVLTGREHYIAHALLEKVYLRRYGLRDQRTYKMICAHMMMGGKDIYCNSHLYEASRQRLSESLMGHPVSEETRAKISYYSSNRSEETLRKIGEASKGRKHTEECKNYISQVLKGRKRSEETRRKISEGKKGLPSHLRGRVMPEEHRKKIADSHAKTYQFLNPEGELTTIVNLLNFCKENKMCTGGFYKLLNGTFKQYRGWRIPQ
jgi:hypothetical protein